MNRCSISAVYRLVHGLDNNEKHPGNTKDCLGYCLPVMRQASHQHSAANQPSVLDALWLKLFPSGFVGLCCEVYPVI